MVQFQCVFITTFGLGLQSADDVVLLVDKSQLDVIKTLRAEVDVEKEGLESEISQLRSQISANQESSKSHQEQIKRLLLDKIDLQSDGIDQRSRALEREHAFRSVESLFLKRLAK